MKKILYILALIFSINSAYCSELLYNPAQDNKSLSVNWEMVPLQYTYNVPVYIETNSIIRKGDYLYFISHSKPKGMEDNLVYTRINTQNNTFQVLTAKEYDPSKPLDKDILKYDYLARDNSFLIRPISSRYYVLRKYCDNTCTPYNFTEQDFKQEQINIKQKNKNLKQEFTSYNNNLSKTLNANWIKPVYNQTYFAYASIQLDNNGHLINYLLSETPSLEIKKSIEDAIKKSFPANPLPSSKIKNIIINISFTNMDNKKRSSQNVFMW